MYNIGSSYTIRLAYSCIFHPCCLLPHFPLPHFQSPRCVISLLPLLAAGIECAVVIISASERRNESCQLPLSPRRSGEFRFRCYDVDYVLLSGRLALFSVRSSTRTVFWCSYEHLNVHSKNADFVSTEARCGSVIYRLGLTAV